MGDKITVPDIVKIKHAESRRSPASPLTIIRLRGFSTRPVSISSWWAIRWAALFKGRRTPCR